MKSSGGNAEPTIGLPPGPFAAAFPFHIAVNGRHEILQLGTSIKQICPDLALGESFLKYFAIIRPSVPLSFSDIANRPRDFYMLEHNSTKLKLRGEFVTLAESNLYVFLGSPWFTDVSEISDHGLAFDNFAVHDSVVDLLQVFQTSKLALADAKNLAMKLTTQRSELQAMNERLRQQEAETRKLALIASRTTNAVVLTDEKGLIIWVNDGFTRLTEFTLEEALGKKPGDLLQGPETDTATIEYMRKCIAEGKGFSVEVVNFSKSHRKYWLEIEVQPIKDEAGKILYFMAIENDITERKSSERVLRESFALQKAMIEGAGNAIIATDTKGLIQLFNPAAEKMLGYSAKELINCRTPETFHIAAEIRARANELSKEFKRTIAPGFEAFIAKARTGMPDQREWSFVRKDGTKLPVLLTITALTDYRGEITGYLGLAIDLTERKEDEKKLRNTLKELAHERDRANAMAAKAEAANRGKSDFLASMSHEIRTPLNIILGNTQLLNQDLKLSGDARNKIHSINRGGEHLLAILNNILDLAKIEAGRVTVTSEDFNVLVLAKDLLLLFNQTCSAKNIHLGLHTTGLTNPTIHADAGKIRQVLVNLLGNAVKFTSQGAIDLFVRCESSNNSNRLIFTVRDTGPGIAAEEIPQLFQEFSQTSTGKKTTGGAGLGLAISKKYAQLLGGDISVESQPGQGTQFHFFLPIHAAKTQGANHSGLVDAAPPQRGSASEFRILVVDDVTDNREFLAEALSKIGYQVQTASSGFEAIDECERWHPNLVLMDTRMPEMSGLETIRKLRGDPAQNHLKIISVTALAYAEDQMNAREAGADDFIAKPVKIEELTVKVAALLNHDTGDSALISTTPDLISVPDRAAKIFSQLPENWRDQFREAVVVADFGACYRLLAGLKLTDQEVSKFVENLLSDFKQEELLRIIG